MEITAAQLVMARSKTLYNVSVGIPVRADDVEHNEGDIEQMEGGKEEFKFEETAKNET